MDQKKPMPPVSIPTASPHSRLTRLVHAGLALAVVVQLATSLLMEKPKPGQPENLFFEVHEYSGLTALAFVFAFWAVVMTRRRGTEAAALFPWTSPARRSAVADDFGRH